MSLSHKIDLENLIFARAAYLHTPVHAKYGGLFSPCKEELLQAFIYVYNILFRKENFNMFCSAQDALEQRQAYLVQRTRLPGLTRIYSVKDLNFELILSEGK